MKKIIINNLLIILIFFFIFEFFLKTFGLSDLRGHGKEFNVKQKNIETTVFGKKVHLDEYGYRVPNKDFKYDNRKEKIIFIGDSVLFGSGVNEKNTFLSKLRNYNKKKDYINAGIVGNDLSENIISINKNKKLFEKGDFLIVYTLDDILEFNKKNNNIKIKNEKVSLIQKLKKNIIFNKINGILRSKSYTYLWLKGHLTKPSERYFFESYNYYNEKDKLKLLKNEFSKIKKIKDTKIKILILPYEYQVRYNCKENLMNPQNEIEKILMELKITYIDLSNEFCNFENPKQLYLNFDPVHLSIIGHELVFNNLKKEFD